MPDIKGLTSGYLLLAAYILPEQQTNLRINPDDAENLLIMFKMFDKPTDLWKLKKAPNGSSAIGSSNSFIPLSYEFFNACKYLLNASFQSGRGLKPF